MKKIMMLAAMLAMVFTAAAPAVAQDLDVSDDDLIDDDSINTVQYEDNSEDNDQFCGPIITQFNSISQGGSGAAALGDGDAVAATANSAGVSNSAVVNCVNGDVNTAVVVAPEDDGDDHGVVHPEDDGDDHAVVHPEDDGDDAAVVHPEDGGDDAAEESSDDAASASGEETASASYSVLPDTGGASLIALGAGALLVAGGLVARRIVR